MRHLALALMCLGEPAFACALPEPFFVADIAAGPIVVVATVTDYRVSRTEAVLTLAVSEVWKGAAPDHLTARWTVKLAEPPPETWNRPKAVIAALAPDGKGFELVVETCGQAWLVPDTPEARAEVHKALTP